VDIFLLLVIAGACLWSLYLWTRLGRVEERLSVLEGNTAQIRELTGRVWRLENPVMPVAEQAPAPPHEEPRMEEAPVMDIYTRMPEVAETIPPAPELPREPSLSDRLRRLLGNEEWEVLVGGSVLNKLGALVLVIGIALFLGYSFGHITPAGRAAMALMVSLAILGTGMWVERLGQYRIFANGLIGAGWAALYATSYAAYAIPEARVIENPIVGSIGMVLVATGMIWHSLRYRSQAVTSVAYFAAFAAMAATPSSEFAVVSLIPLAGSLLYLAARFEWHSMALFGLAATYLTCISKGNSGAPLAATQSLFLAYWLLFEGFDLLRMKRRLTSGALDLLFPLNTACFLGLSYLTWSAHAADQLWVAAAFGSTLFLADSIARAVLRPPASFADADLPARLRAGSYEGAFLVAAVLAGLAIVGRVPGVWTGVSLAAEAEIVYLAGLRLRSSFLRRLGGSAFALSLLRVFWGPEAQAKTVVSGSYSIWNWTPPALVHAFLFYMNRAIRRPNAIFSSSAALIVAMVLAADAPAAFAGTVLVLFGIVLFEIGLRGRALEFRVQAYAGLALGLVLTALPDFDGLQRDSIALAISLAALYGFALRSKSIGGSIGTAVLVALFAWRLVPEEYMGLAWSAAALGILELGSRGLPAALRLCFGPFALLTMMGVVGFNAAGFMKFPAASVWITYTGACIAAFAATARFTLRPPEEAAEWERTVLRDAVAILACAAGLAATWLVVPDAAVTILWTLIAAAVFESGLALRVASFGSVALAVLAVVYYRVFTFDLDNATLTATPFAIAGMYWIWYRSPRTAVMTRVQFWAALLPVLFLIERQAGSHNAPLGWAVAALVLLLADRFTGVPDARRQSYAVAALAFIGAMWLDIDPPRLWICALSAACFYIAQYLAKHSEDRRAPVYFSLLGTLLLSSLLYGRVSGGLLTVSWGLQGLALLACGFGLRERVLRLEGLALLMTCILKLFLYDLRNLETIYRILSFVALGLILLCVSWIYSRFREHIRRLL
jgi:hypothetical protein